MIRLMVIMTLLFFPSAAQDDIQTKVSPHKIGDPALKEKIAVETRRIYDQAGSWLFLLTRENVMNIPGAQNTDIRGGFIDGEPARIIATVMTDTGKYSAEFYLQNDALIHVYETFEYFNETAPVGAWRNFKGLAAWERRGYFNEKVAGYMASKGLQPVDPASYSTLLQDRLQNLLKRIDIAQRSN